MLTDLARSVKISLFIILGVFFLHSYSEAGAVKEQTKQTDASVVCMVNNTVMGKPQIPVEFEGKTYYGCCEGCVGRLKSDRSVRYAVDPVTGREVDKARAVIIKGPAGEALYFESLNSATMYTPASR